MMKMLQSTFVITVFFILITACGGDKRSADHQAENASLCQVTGELMQWHRVALLCQGPEGSEDEDATFTDYRLNVTFSQGNTRITVPGHFAADNDAANSGLDKGNIWRTYFAPSLSGEWTYSVSFRQGKDIAVSMDANAGTPVVGIDGDKGSFTIKKTDAIAPDMRGKGLLRHVDGERYLRFEGDDQVYIQGGVDSPENIFGYFEFDNTTKHDNVKSCKGILHQFLPHAADWNQGDPTWGDGRGRHLIGLINYYASKGLNSVYVMMNTVNGDGCDAHPWRDYNSEGSARAFDISKLDQWEIVLNHMTASGIMIHAMTQETENDHLLNDGELGLERKLYYRELISRFGHHPALQWNLGEENTNTTAQRQAYADYIKAVDPYNHPIKMHTYPDQHQEYDGMLGHDSFDGATFQVRGISEEAHEDSTGVYGIASQWLARSEDEGHQWVTTFTEASGGDAPKPNQGITDRQRIYWMWASVMSGGGGFEWYLKNNKKGHALDLSVEDLHQFDELWEQTSYLVTYFRDVIQTEYGIEMSALSPDNDVTTTTTDWVLSKTGETYLIFLREGGSTAINLPIGTTYQGHWYNPRTGKLTELGPISGTAQTEIGIPPTEANADWVLLLQKEN